VSNHLNYSRRFLLWSQTPSGSSTPDTVAWDGPSGFAVDIRRCLREGVKILLPPSGIVFDDPAMRGISGSEFKLPHPVCVFEFAHAVRDSKWIVIAKQFQDGSVGCVAVVGSNDGSQWLVDGARVPFTLVPEGDVAEKIRIIYRNRESFPSDRDHESHKMIVSFALWAVVDAVNALACRNVQLSPSRFNRPKNATPKGAIPFDDYHVLTIDAPGKPGVSQAHGGTHRSPREHLRRGHIRRIASGAVWVNACVVSAGNGGKLFKDYAVRSA
jgi:hypothetical protein